QDGAPLTAADAVFTYGLLTSPDIRSGLELASILRTAEITEVDARTVRLTLAEPMASLPAHLSLGLLPKHLLGNVAPRDLADSAFNRAPIGAGPYRLDELTPAYAVLSPNTAYHFAQPYIHRL